MAATLLVLLGGIIAIGFLGNLFFERTRIPDILLLIGIGLLLGPVFQIVPPDAVRPFMSAFGAIALTIILFEGGLDLDIKNTLRQAGRAFLLAAFSFTFTLFLVYYALVIGLNAHDRIAWAVSAALACTSAPIVIPVMSKLLPKSSMRPLVTVEAALSDALAVMMVLALLGLDKGGFSGSIFFGKLGKAFLIGGGVSLIAGISWLWLLSHLYNQRFFYLMTIGMVFLLMGVVETLHGSGALAVLIFGIILANGEVILGLFSPGLRLRVQKLFAAGQVALHPRISESHAEISFLIRSFFFVYLGIIFRWPGEDLRMWLTILIVIIALLIGREVAVQLTAWTTKITARDRKVLNAMLPRGLATAVLSAMLMSRTSSASPSWETLATFIVIISNVLMTIKLMKMPRETALANNGR